MKLRKRDHDFITKTAMPYFGIKELMVKWDNSTKKYPDIWVDLSNRPPQISVTREWARQGEIERKKRIVHELLHVRGMEHDDAIGYSTYPDKDTYSMNVYKHMITTRSRY